MKFHTFFPSFFLLNNFLLFSNWFICISQFVWPILIYLETENFLTDVWYQQNFGKNSKKILLRKLSPKCRRRDVIYEYLKTIQKYFIWLILEIIVWSWYWSTFRMSPKLCQFLIKKLYSRSISRKCLAYHEVHLELYSDWGRNFESEIWKRVMGY